MRVIGGEFRSRVLKSVPGLDTRPTPDRLREALFSAIGAEVEGAVFADLYAGTGAVGIEALSRGAKRAIFIEQHRAAVKVIRENVAALGIEDRAEIRPGKVRGLAPGLAAEIVFVDPPYELDAEYEASFRALAQASCGLLLVQHDARRKLPETCGRLTRVRTMKHGGNCVSFYRAPANGPAPE